MQDQSGSPSTPDLSVNSSPQERDDAAAAELEWRHDVVKSSMESSITQTLNEHAKKGWEACGFAVATDEAGRIREYVALIRRREMPRPKHTPSDGEPIGPVVVKLNRRGW